MCEVMIFVKGRKDCRIHDVDEMLAGVTFVFAFRVAVSSLHSYEAASEGRSIRNSPCPKTPSTRNSSNFRGSVAR